MADNSLLEKVLGLQEKYEALQAQLSDPEVIADMKKFVQLNKEYKELWLRRRCWIRKIK